MGPDHGVRGMGYCLYRTWPMREEGHHLHPGIGHLEDSHRTLWLTLLSSCVSSDHTAIFRQTSTPATQQQGHEALAHGSPTEDHYRVPAQGTERTCVDSWIHTSSGKRWISVEGCGWSHSYLPRPRGHGEEVSSEHKESREEDQASGRHVHGHPLGCAVEFWLSLGTWVGTKAPPA